MAYSANVVANAFIDLATDKPVTNMKLQKLVYISEGFSLAMLGKSLFANSIRAFQWGPVIPELYESLKVYGNAPVSSQIQLSDEEGALDLTDPNNVEAAIIRGVWEKYGDLTAAQLSAITHKEGTPWQKVWSKHPYGEIPRPLIKHHYRELLAQV